MTNPLRTLAFALAAAAAVALPAPEAAAQAGGPRYYTVMSGDTLWSIAQRYRVTASEIADRSHLAAPFALRRGMRLHLPSRAAPDPAPSPCAPAPSAAPAASARTAPAVSPAARAMPSALARVAPTRPIESSHRPGGGRWGRPARPGVVRLVRVHDGESVTLDMRRIGPVTRGRARQFFRAASGQTHPIDPRLLRQLAIVSDHFGGRTIEVVSAFRPRRRRQWTRHSMHNIGHAVDFRVEGVSNRAARDFCRTLPATGCGYYPRSVFIHMDTRSESTTWVDWSRPGERPRYGSESGPPPERRAVAPAAHPADTPDPSVPPVGAETELDDVADDAPAIRGADPRPDDTSAAPDEPAAGGGSAPNDLPAGP